MVAPYVFLVIILVEFQGLVRYSSLKDDLTNACNTKVLERKGVEIKISIVGMTVQKSNHQTVWHSALEQICFLKHGALPVKVEGMDIHEYRRVQSPHAFLMPLLVKVV